MLEMAALFLAVTLSLFLLRKQFYALFFIVLLTTEFFYIEIGGGNARPYHFFAVLVVLKLFPYVHHLLRSKIFIALLVFVGVNSFSIIYSDYPGRAAASFLSLGANIAVAMATALILYSQNMSFSVFKRIVLVVTLVSICWGLLQILAHRFVGLNLALQFEQIRQISDGFGPGFRTEANTFGKFMVVPFLLFLPDYLKRQSQHIGLIYLAFLVGIFMNFTRTSLYGMSAALILIAIWYLSRGQFGLFAKRSVKVSCAVLLGIFLVINGAVNVSDYARYKLQNFFNKEEVLSGGSSGYRLDMMRLVLEDAMSNDKTFLVGKGWGQTQYYYHHRDVTAGGGDIITLLGYAGILGVLSYLSVIILSIISTGVIAKKCPDKEMSGFAEGTMFAFLGMFCVGQMAGYLIMPEFWMIVGMCIYLSMVSSTSNDDSPKGLAMGRL